MSIANKSEAADASFTTLRGPGSYRPTVVGSPGSRFGRSLAVVVGVDTYGPCITPLRSAVADARAIAEALERDHGFETWRLFDEDAGLPRLVELLEKELPAALGDDDRLLLYFAGHGIALDGDRGPTGYLVPHGATRADRSSFLPMQVLHGALAKLPVRHAFIVLDCCFAGTFRWASMRDVEPVVAKIYRERYDRYLDRAAWQVLTSTSDDELALDGLAEDRREQDASPHSPFAQALLDGLGGQADYTGDNVLTADELAMYVRERVAPAAEGAGRRQVPQLLALDWHDGGQFAFTVPNETPVLDPAPPLDEDANPYRGLESHGEHSRALFFGRDAVTAALVGAVDARRLTVVVGASCSGKSSLVHAGLLPALRTRGWTILSTQRPGRRPLAALEAWSRELGAPSSAVDQAASWIAAARARPDHGPWLVVIDQLQELFTRRTDPGDRETFLGALAAALEASPSLHIVVTVRSDTEPGFRDSALATWWMPGRFPVPAMARDELRRVIEQPALAAVVHFESSRLVERLLDDVALVPAPLPLLSFALGELYRRCWQRWQSGERDRTLREADYDDMGGVAGALPGRATMLHDQLVARDPAYATTMRNVFTRMVAVGRGEVAGRRVRCAELVYDDDDENRRIAEVLRQFEAAQLIPRGTEQVEDGRTSSYVEAAHDELVRGWTLVSRWLDELDAVPGTRSLLCGLSSAVGMWRTQQLDDAYLWNDPRVKLAQRLGRKQPALLNAHESRFLRRSARLRYGRRTWVIGVFAAVAVIAGFALLKWRSAAADADDANGRCEEIEAAEPPPPDDLGSAATAFAR